MHIEALNKETLDAFRLVANVPIVKKAYLAGGTALALHLGHRISEDLDFFSQTDFEEDILEEQMKAVEGFELGDKNWKTIKGFIGSVKFSLFWYKYPLIEPTQTCEGIQILGLKDLAGMKVHAITGRGVRRDYIDLYFLRKLFRQVEMMGFYEQKYGDFENRAGMIFRALSYLDDAEDTPMPEMLVKVDWDEVKEFFEQEAREFAKEYIGI